MSVWSAARQLLVGKQFIAGRSPNAKRQVVPPQVRAPGGSMFVEQVAAFIHYQQLRPGGEPAIRERETICLNPPISAL